MKRIYSAVLLLVLFGVASSAFAWPTPPARDITISTNGYTRLLGGTNLQNMFNWMDTNVLTTGNGYVTESWINTHFGTSSTQAFARTDVLVPPTNSPITLGKYYGFSAMLQSNTTTTITNPAGFNAVTNIFVKLRDANTWFATNTSRFTPTYEGYYQITVQACGNNTGVLRVANADTSVLYLATMDVTNNYVSGSGQVWANGTNTYWELQGQGMGGATAVIKWLVFEAHYLGR